MTLRDNRYQSRVPVPGTDSPTGQGPVPESLTVPRRGTDGPGTGPAVGWAAEPAHRPVPGTGTGTDAGTDADGCITPLAPGEVWTRRYAFGDAATIEVDYVEPKRGRR